MIWAEAGLRLRTLVWVAAYTVLLSLAVVAHGWVVNEHAEELMWESLLRFELQHFIDRRAQDPSYRWDDPRGLRLYEAQSLTGQPALLRGLPDGLHDELLIDGREYVVLVQHVDGRRYVLTLEISALEDNEYELIVLLAGSAVGLVTVFGLLLAWVLQRTVRPLADTAQRIARLQPQRGGQRIPVGRDALPELRVIVNALNGYLERNERFVERERSFIDTASHELRTPIAVVAGSSALALRDGADAQTVRRHLRRIRDAALRVEELITLLLVLAKDPARLAASNERLSLADVVAQVVEDHRHLSAGKQLSLRLLPAPPCCIDAPLPMLQSAVGNLLRNAIENSDDGEIVVGVTADATVEIADPGHGMSAQQIAGLYARLARGEHSGGGGLGLALIARLCDHLGWQLQFATAPGRGTITTLRFAVQPPTQ